VPEKLLTLKMPKLIFQPIVENAISHGLEKKEGQGNIHITAQLQGEHAEFIIMDDGEGMERETLLQLNKTITQGVEDSSLEHGIGLINVNERIKLHYGISNNLYCESKPGMGTKVIFSLLYPSD
jgi:two-component system sensor histidine kinase YesM